MSSTLITVIAVVGFGVITGAIILITVFKILHSAKQKQQLRKSILVEGFPAEAMIHEITQTSSSMDGRPGVQMDLTVTQVDGRTFPATVETFIPVTHMAHFQKGNVINVKYIVDGNTRKVEVEDAYIP